MNDVIDLIQSHRSIRRYKDRPIDEKLLSNIIAAGQAAATSSFIQATTIIRITDPKLREAFVELSGNQKYIHSCAEFLVFCADLHRNQQRVMELAEAEQVPDFDWTEQFLAATVDVALVAQNTVIAAESAGLGVCYIGGIRNAPFLASELLGLPKLVYPVFGLCLGYPDQNPDQKPRLPQASILHENKYRYSDIECELINAYDAHVREYYIARTSGKLDYTWSEQMRRQASTQTRPFIKKFINNQGFANK